MRHSIVKIVTLLLMNFVVFVIIVHLFFARYALKIMEQNVAIVYRTPVFGLNAKDVKCQVVSNVL